MTSEDLSFSEHGFHVEELCGNRVRNGFVVREALCTFLGLLQWA